MCTGNGAHGFKIDLSGPIETVSEILLRLSNLKNHTNYNIYSNKKKKHIGEKDEKYHMWSASWALTIFEDATLFFDR